ncbi:MAG: DUF1592 domain-containing protein [Acidobacteria bacterium]|nr:DUF1592 domain-containing protein [Acidobacteriota bacterium]
MAFRILLCIWVLPVIAASSDVIAFVDKNCTGCHNAAVKNGDIDLKSLRGARTFDADREVWEKVSEKLKTGQMPPPGFPKPASDAVKSVTHWLEAEFARQDRTAKPDAGRVSARRLNRAEYNNTIRDLLGVDNNPAGDFPADTAAFGFDNISDALTLPPALMEKYVDAAERAVRTAIFGPEKRKPAAIHYPAPVRINDSRGTRYSGRDFFNYDFTGLSTPHSAHFIHRFPVDGVYIFRVVLNGHRPNQSSPARPALFIDGKQVHEWEIDATDLEGQIVEARMKVTAGEKLVSTSYLKTYHGLPPSYGGPEPSTRPEVALINAQGKLTEADIETLRKYGTRIKTDAVETRIDNRFESLDIGGPFEQTAGPSAESVRRIFTCQEKTDGCASRIIGVFLRRAFRRPVTALEVDRYSGFYAMARKHGDSFEEGVAIALQAILVSPQFLYRIEQDRAATTPAAPISDIELASRLSYFLWSSTPDEELLRAAANGTLRRPAPLEAQVKRMLRDPKAAAMVENFAGQWLQFKNMDVVRPDQEKFPVFDDGLRLAMRRETEHFLEHIVRNDGNVLDVLDANYTFLNERLARFYGVAGVTGPEFRRVDMSGTNRGGGILAHASVLTVSSYSTRTSPVLRGKWVLETLLNSPAPPPPPGVPPLEETKAGKGTLRQQMEQHRSNPACASCHARLDPPGFGLENFDAIGAWRAKDGDNAVDASGALPDGRTFQSPAQLKEILKSEKEAYLRGVAERLLTYALGRGLERFDRPAVARIVAAMPVAEYKFSALVMGVVRSLPFQNRRAADKMVARAQ